MNHLKSNWQLDHIGIAVPILQPAIEMYAQRGDIQVTLREQLESQGVELAFLDTGTAKVELLAPLHSSSTLARFLEKRGPGLHHICYSVTDIEAELAKLASHGCSLIDKAPRPGAAGTRIAFLHPSSFAGVLTELCQHPAGKR
jgi:methylmalonyl-CoA/ethylmalonyl-CoA epimerase